MDGFYVKFDAESNGDAAGIPKPCSDLSIACYEKLESGVQRFSRHILKSLNMRGLKMLK